MPLCSPVDKFGVASDPEGRRLKPWWGRLSCTLLSPVSWAPRSATADLLKQSNKIRYSLAGWDTRLSPERSGLEPRFGGMLLCSPMDKSRVASDPMDAGSNPGWGRLSCTLLSPVSWAPRSATAVLLNKSNKIRYSLAG